MASWADDVQLLGRPICVLCHQVSGIQDGAEVFRVSMYVPADKSFLFFQEHLDELYEAFMG